MKNFNFLIEFSLEKLYRDLKGLKNGTIQNYTESEMTSKVNTSGVFKK